MVAIDIDIITIINWVIAFGLPLLVGVITKRMSESLPKVLWLAGLNVVNSALGELARSLQEGTVWSLGSFLFTLMGALAVAYGAYSNVWKPTGAAARVQGFKADSGAPVAPTGVTAEARHRQDDPPTS